MFGRGGNAPLQSSDLGSSSSVSAAVLAPLRRLRRLLAEQRSVWLCLRTRAACGATSPRTLQLGDSASPALAMQCHRRRQRFRRLVVERAVQVAEYFHRILPLRFRNRPGYLPAVTDEHDLF